MMLVFLRFLVAPSFFFFSCLLLFVFLKADSVTCLHSFTFSYIEDLMYLNRCQKKKTVYS